MRVLLIKTSSMGDVIHTLPALTDAMQHLPGIQFDWVIEKSFAEIPTWHPAVAKVIPIALRRWRKNLFSRDTLSALKTFKTELGAAAPYDLILDAQGLVKSAWIGFLTKGLRAGLDFKSAREKWASLAYQKKYTVNFKQHAIIRMRQLLSQALGYALTEEKPQFGLHVNLKKYTQNLKTADLILLHGTTWASKQWPETYWQQLAYQAAESGMRVMLGGGNVEEAARAERVAKTHPGIFAQPFLSIAQMAALLAEAKCVVAVDTGFAHLAAALSVKTICLYGSTSAVFTGVMGAHAFNLSADFPCAPCLKRECTYPHASEVRPACFTQLTPARVWELISTSSRIAL